MSKNRKNRKLLTRQIATTDPETFEVKHLGSSSRKVPLSRRGRLHVGSVSPNCSNSLWLRLISVLLLVSCNLNSLAFEEAYFDFSTPVVSKKVMVSHRCFVPQAFRDKRQSPKGLCLFRIVRRITRYNAGFLVMRRGKGKFGTCLILLC